MSDGACMAYQWAWESDATGAQRLVHRKALLLAPSPNYKRRRETFLRMEVRWEFEELQPPTYWQLVANAAFTSRLRREPAWVRDAGDDALVRRCRGCGVDFCPVGGNQMRHCSARCRLQFGHAAADQRLAERMGVPADQARRELRRQQRRAQGIGPRLRGTVAPGERFGWWQVLCDAVIELPNTKPRRGARCRCECGREQVIAVDRLLRGETSSCKGCRFKRQRAEVSQCA